MAIAIWASRAIYAAARLGIADLLAGGPKTAEAIADATGTHAPSIHRLLRALASRGLFTETAPKTFALTPLGAALRTGAPGAARGAVLTLAGDWQWKAWDEFLYSLKTGKPAMDKVWNAPLFDYLVANPEDGALFDEAMVGMHEAEGPAVVAVYDFSKFKSIVDLGGGTGSLLTAILRTYPQLRGIVFDLEKTMPAAERRLADAGLRDRCDAVAGDFFKSVPADHDCYLLSHVLHDWTDEQSIAILRNCRKAIPSDGRLLIVETVLPPGDVPHHGKLLDLLMLTVPGGLERTADEYAGLLEAAAFRLSRVIPTQTPQSIVEAMPV
ncbi:MAG: methyltransferase [Pseudolabrys sp.]